MMKITVKILQGPQCTVEVPESATVPDLKLQVSEALGIPSSQQRLVLRGRPLPDDKTLHDCGVGDGQRLFLVVKKQEESPGCPGYTWKPLEEFLAKHYRDHDVKLILDEFIKNFKKTTSKLSLDDIERLSTAVISGT